MTEKASSAIGTVAQEAARLIEEMTTMARSSYQQGQGAGPYDDERAQRHAWPDMPPPGDPADGNQAPNPEAMRCAAGDSAAGGHEPPADPSGHTCSVCGAERNDPPMDDTPSTCRLCPLCRGVSLLRSVRPETVDLLADLAMSVAASLRDMAVRSRASDPSASARPASGRPTSGPTSGSPSRSDRTSVQDIQVDDESEG